MGERDALTGLATLWTSALATLVVAVRGGELLLVLTALPLLAVACRVTRLHARRVGMLRSPRRARATSAPMRRRATPARQTPRQPRPRVARAPRSSAA